MYLDMAGSDQQMMAESTGARDSLHRNGHLRERVRFDSFDESQNTHGRLGTCVGKSFAIKISLISAFGLASAALSTVYAAEGPVEPGLSFEQVKSYLDPLWSFLATVIWAVVSVWNYIVTHPPAAVLISTLIASTVAVVSIQVQRQITRLKETFSTLNSDNWDKDVIKARTDFRRIRNEIKDSPHEIAKYCFSPEKDEDAITLQTISNDYENLALGVRLNIIDEYFLYRWMRSTLIRDWTTLAPLITAYRSKFENQDIYIEFEGLAMAWQKSRSYRNGRKMQRASKSVRVK